MTSALTASSSGYGNSGWITFSFTAPTPGSYTFQLGATNRLDNSVNGGAVIDGAIPEPATWTVLIGGVAMVGVAARRLTRGHGIGPRTGNHRARPLLFCRRDGIRL